MRTCLLELISFRFKLSNDVGENESGGSCSCVMRRTNRSRAAAGFVVSWNVFLFY